MFKDENTAIMLMMMGQRGQIENVTLSQKYNEAMSTYNAKYNAFAKKYAYHPEFLKDFDEVNDAHDEEHAVAEEDIYMSAFSFGVLMGIDIMHLNNANN